MKSLELGGIPTKKPTPEVKKPAASRGINVANNSSSRINSKTKVSENPKSFRITSKDSERFEEFRAMISESQNGAKISDVKVFRAMLLLTEIAPKRTINKILEMMI